MYFFYSLYAFFTIFFFVKFSIFFYPFCHFFSYFYCLYYIIWIQSNCIIIHLPNDDITHDKELHLSTFEMIIFVLVNLKIVLTTQLVDKIRQQFKIVQNFIPSKSVCTQILNFYKIILTYVINSLHRFLILFLLSPFLQ